MKTRGPATSARAAALRALMLGGDSAAALDRVLKEAHLDSRDRAFATELAHGTLKRRRTLIWALQSALRQPFEKLDTLLQWILLIGAYQLLYLERVPAHSAVDESVTLARTLGHAGLAATANAVLRRISRERPQPPAPTREGGAAALGLYASLPDWIAQSYIDRFGFEEASKIGAAINAAPRRALRADISRWSDAQARNALEQAGFETAYGALGVPECIVLEDSSHGDRRALNAAIDDGRLTVQSEESQYAVHLLAPAAGEMILDVCAGRGVKTGAIAARMHGDGRIIAVDDDHAKLKTLAKASERLATPTSIVHADARSSYDVGAATRADAALVDAPCSGLGILGRRADARWRKQPGDPARFARVQAGILASAAHHVKPGGRLLYVTCSTAPLEDESVVEGFLVANPAWRARPLSPPADASGITRVGDALLSEPGINGGDGFFYALLERAT
ncbi:MAG: 16S rRNA (cytosine(967)-C(5))-methyltransferase RsmB [Candidatus Eremiobacteraeota bacterium]|nr:16S rRNA (cytosine(967)-C(5))-methyltransferase RsmB [Candidatus Eremiobacteraeota bacterium]